MNKTTIFFNRLPAWFTHPAWIKALGIIAGTFLLEDATTVMSAMAVQEGRMSISLALCALYVGVAGGDLGLYGLGWLGSRWPLVHRYLTLPRGQKNRTWFADHVIRIVFISRFVPGARLPFYTACGFFEAPLSRFAISAIGATLIWTTMLFIISLHVGAWMSAHLAGWRWVGAAGFAASLVFTMRMIARSQA